MLKKIAVQELTLGMHLHEMCGAWLDHPFWKTKFVLTDPADLAKLRNSGVTHCVIDLAKSVQRSAPDVPPAAPATPSQAPELPATQTRATTPMEEEQRRAAQLIDQSRKAVQSLFNEARMGQALDVQKCLPMVDEIASSVWRNPGAFVSLARLKTHDDYTYMHSVAVCALMVSLARQLGHDDTQARAAGLAGLVHDIGKACMPLDVLNKPGKLTSEEYTLIQTHPKRGHELLGETGAAGDLAMDVCLHHHERPDGKGYPDRLAEGPLSLPAKMGAVCDVYDAITSNRPYKSGWDPADSIAQMADWAQKGQFDLAVFQAFAKSLGIYPIGSLVRLQSGRLGVVVDQSSKSLLMPLVKVFFSTRSQLHIPPEVVDLSHTGCSDRIIGRESNEKWKFKQLDELWAGAEALQKLGR
ncbi:MAG: HD-GYP domain-containing protein [Burkholderiaceae bacterium]